MRPMMRKLVLLLCAAAAYAVGFQPTWMLRDSVLAAFGSPAYQGVWILIPHLLLYSTLSALVCLGLWLALIGAKWLPPMPFAVAPYSEVVKALVEIVPHIAFRLRRSLMAQRKARRAASRQRTVRVWSKPR